MSKKKKIKYIFIAGGVMSGVGKGVAAASIGAILQSKGFKVTAIKIDPYVNVDAGTMNPTEHGEVFVLNDGTECDQDMGNYERFLGTDLNGANYMTTGSVYMSVIQRERNLEYGGKCVEVVPHIPLEVLSRIKSAAEKSKSEIVITEIGGTVGEYQNILFLEAVRILKIKHPGDVVLVLVSFLPSLEAGGTELKTKPTQYAVRTLNSAGLQPDIILARASSPLDAKRKNTIYANCNILKEDIISAPNVSNIYEIPINFEKDNLSSRILSKLGLKQRKSDMKKWRRLNSSIRRIRNTVKIGIVGKYFGSGNFYLTDSYISVLEAVKHASYSLKRIPVIEWINSEEFERNKKKIKNISKYDGIIIPGGFGSRGVEGKISVIKYCRENRIPYLGLCYGMQLAIVEFVRNKLKLKNANTTEIDKETPNPVIDIMPEQKKNIAYKNYGGSMRLGAYPAILLKNTIAYGAYKEHIILERHRHRYEVNPKYIEAMKKKGIVFSGMSPDKRLMEIAELSRKEHPFFLAVQFHPEFKSRPFSPHPLFKEFIKSAVKIKKTK